MADIKIKDCLRVWRRTYGEQKTGSKYGQTIWSIPIRGRRDLIIIFLTAMRERGFNEEHFRKKTFQDDLIDICFGSAPAFDEKKRKLGHAALREELEDVLATEGIFSGEKPNNELNAKLEPFVPKEYVPPTEVKKGPILREDVSEAPYEADPSSVDEDFLQALKDAANE